MGIRIIRIRSIELQRERRQWARATHIFLCKVNEVLQVNVIPVGFDVVIDEQIELVFDPVLKHEGQDPRRQLQEEDEPQEYRELGDKHRPVITIRMDTDYSLQHSDH